MIKAEIKRDHVCISGHAGQGTFGYDVICAGVSALTIAIINSLEWYVGIKTDAVIKEGYAEFFIHPMNKLQTLQASTLTRTLYLALTDMQKENPESIEVIIPYA